eukprot:CAMPEP_0114290664 /NCGR_PEP_ID=MMETSP0059-20121206/8062_1 /TAXON_ID=36894 /ORGANISM="Pyramimonas parkeae, Strain CCMP726" /LENGTH=368 /DNA_ID=CAMNT_0001412087 /DNA_START=358 /DNA_END=1464 /DNA_ORIENTATION=+
MVHFCAAVRCLCPQHNAAQAGLHVSWCTWAHPGQGMPFVLLHELRVVLRVIDPDVSALQALVPLDDVAPAHLHQPPQGLLVGGSESPLHEQVALQVLHADLDARELASKTIVVFGGEAADPHHLLAHGGHWDESVHAPVVAGHAAKAGPQPAVEPDGAVTRREHRRLEVVVAPEVRDQAPALLPLHPHASHRDERGASTGEVRVLRQDAVNHLCNLGSDSEASAPLPAILHQLHRLPSDHAQRHPRVESCNYQRPSRRACHRSAAFDMPELFQHFHHADIVWEQHSSRAKPKTNRILLGAEVCCLVLSQDGNLQSRRPGRLAALEQAVRRFSMHLSQLTRFEASGIRLVRFRTPYLRSLCIDYSVSRH